MTKHFGYWIFGKDMDKVNLENLFKYGVTDVFLNYYAFTVHGESKVLSWIKNAKNKGINTHIWVQSFYDGEWHNPKTTDLTNKINEIKKYSTMENVYGIHLDYLRYPGTAYKTSGGAEAITNFVKNVKNSISNSIFLSCAVMPEEDDKYYYGQDITELGKIVDVILPMQYKGNYGAGTSWLSSTTQEFSKKTTIWSGLQTYKSDDDETQLSANELLNDGKTCINSGANGVVLFRYGISPEIDFRSLQDKEGEKVATKKHTYKEIVEKAKKCKDNVEKKYKLGINTAWVYYICKAVMKVNTDFDRIGTIKEAPNPRGDYISNQIYKKDYFDMAKRLIKFVEANKKLPNYITVKLSNKSYNVRVRDYIYMFSRILVYYDKNGKFPKYANVNSKSFTKPSESKNVVYDYFVKKHFKPVYLDDVCDWVRDHVDYLFYFDDEKSNKEVIDSQEGNCTDLLQFLVNMADALGYEWKVIHTQCVQSGTGHVYGKFRKKGNSEWFIRDIACIADNSEYCVWCNVDTGGGYLLDTNPSWFLENLNR